MAADFFTEYKKTQFREAGYSNRKADKGGETIFGISRNYHPEWGGWPKVDLLKASPDFPAIAERSPELQSLAGQFYKERFWNAFNLDELKNQALAGVIFDTAINFGESAGDKTGAPRWTQEALNEMGACIEVDGIFGPKTMGAIKVLGSSQTAAELLISKILKRRIRQRVAMLEGEDISALPEDSQYRNIKGWLNRDLQLF